MPNATQPARIRSRKKITKTVLVRLTKDQENRIKEQAAVLRSSAARVLIAAWERSAVAENISLVGSLNGNYAVAMPAVADAALLAGLRQLGGLIGHAARNGVVDWEQADVVLKSIREATQAYKELIRKVTHAP